MKHDVVCVVSVCCVLSQSPFSVLCATVLNSAGIIRNSNYILPAV